MTPSELVLPFEGSYVCANFGENRSRNATVRVLADGQTDTHTHTHTHTDANRFHNLSHAICYSYGTDNYVNYVNYMNDYYYIIIMVIINIIST